jgi:16S rRNA (guanine527-N7)-methyltransferase
MAPMPARCAGMKAAATGPLLDHLAENWREVLRLVPVSRETGERLVAYVDLLARWQKTTNLIAKSTFWTRPHPAFRACRASAAREPRL